MIYAKAIGALGLVLLLAFGLVKLYDAGYAAGEHNVQVQWDADTIRRDTAQRDALLAYANRITQGEQQHDEDQATIAQLADAARRVRIHLPATCGNNTASAPGQNGGAGVLSTRVDESFARLQDRAERLFTRCDQLNIDAIRSNASR